MFKIYKTYSSLRKRALKIALSQRRVSQKKKYMLALRDCIKVSMKAIMMNWRRVVDE